MIDFTKEGKIVITCYDRNAPFLEAELEALDFKIDGVFRTHVALRGSLNDCIFLNMHLRTASHVLYEIHSFSLDHIKDLYKVINELPWEEYIETDGYFSVISNVKHETVDNPLFVNVKIKDAIADRFRDKFGERPDSGSDLNEAVFQFFWKGDQASIYINTSGDTLIKHGYRKIPGSAPMMESLAAASLIASGWDQNSPFVNPMCGSGTVAIEATLMATNRYPGLFRDDYAFMYINGYDAGVYYGLKKDLEAKIKPSPDFPIIASDISERAINASKANARQAGVAEYIQFEVCDFREATIPEADKGAVFFNPEYGERLGEEDELELTYREIGDFMKKSCAGYTGLVFTGNLDLGKRIGLKPKRRIPFYNGTIDCRLLVFELYKGSKTVSYKSPEKNS
ncbi:THUMP domain-containing class I SAM-dependent RNA methyltransferase [Cyclobacterium marinum]|uniref:THUMP domain-containing class I SAM-dependent RNA methyltransferase n=1 Tax=Cyclobacterium marinum TaxID=104 RepID=UPI0011EF5F12|nr:THUMP domain-containing protein [Cyclobacterium marinum]MBI0398325.1 class I SAM-dependent RNA methyltransferase [Cyclobacterium marinum]